MKASLNPTILSGVRKLLHVFSLLKLMERVECYQIFLIFSKWYNESCEAFTVLYGAVADDLRLLSLIVKITRRLSISQFSLVSANRRVVSLVSRKR